MAEITRRGWLGRRQPHDVSVWERRLENLLAPLRQVLPGLTIDNVRLRSSRVIHEASLIAWLARADALAAHASLPSFNPYLIDESFIAELVALSRDPDGPAKVADSLSARGIAFVVLGELPNTHVDGAAWMAVSGNPVIALSLRCNRLGRFWFDLLHELAHAALHLRDGARGVFVDDFMARPLGREAEADRMAADWLIPSAGWEHASARLIEEPRATAVAEFASRIGVHPAVAWERVLQESGCGPAPPGMGDGWGVRHLFPSLAAGWVSQGAGGASAEWRGLPSHGP